MTRFVLAIVVALFASVAFAQTPTPADAAFKRGRELLKAGKYADACVEFEHSQKLDPALGTEFNIAQCSEKTGKLARALELYRGMLPRDQNAERKKIVADAIPKLEARVPKLIVKVASPPAGLVLTIQVINSGQPPKALEANKELEMDFGEYAIVGKATGAPDWNQNVRIDTEAKVTSLEAPFRAPTKTTVPLNSDAMKLHGAVTTDPVEKTDEPESPPKSRRKLFGIIGMGVGGAALIGGVVFGTQASGKWDDAKKVCGGTTCTTTADLDRANKLGDEARSKATLSTVFVIAGTAIAAGGVVLFLTAPKAESSTQVTAHPTNGGAGVTLSGRF